MASEPIVDRDTIKKVEEEMPGRVPVESDLGRFSMDITKFHSIQEFAPGDQTDIVLTVKITDMHRDETGSHASFKILSASLMTPEETLGEMEHRIMRMQEK